MKALRQVGWRAVWRYVLYSSLMVLYRLAWVSPLRVQFLKILGARIGKNVVIHDLHFFNYYRKGFGAIQIGDNSFIGDETLFDLADDIILENDVTLAERVTVLTHTNVGYQDHPLQKYFPPFTRPVHLQHGSFVGVNATIMPGVVVGSEAFIAAGAVATQNVEPRTIVGGVPARRIRSIEDQA